jgi:HSP20 family protein
MKEEQQGYRSEFRYGELSRTMRLPEGITGDDVTATYQHGILKVVVPVPAQTEPEVKTIPVTKV